MDLTINDRTVQVTASDDTALLWVLRDLLGMTGTKFGCGMALCGACTVHVDGKPVRSCMLTVGVVRYMTPFTTRGVPASRPPGESPFRGSWYIHARLSAFTLPSLIFVSVL